MKFVLPALYTVLMSARAKELTLEREIVSYARAGVERPIEREFHLSSTFDCFAVRSSGASLHPHSILGILRPSLRHLNEDIDVEPHRAFDNLELLADYGAKPIGVGLGYPEGEKGFEERDFGKMSSASEQSFYIESEEEEDEEKEFNKAEDDGNNSESSNHSNENRQQSKPNSLNTTWPQSYRSWAGSQIPTSGIRASSVAFRNKNSVVFETAQKSSCSKSGFEHTRSKGSRRGVQPYKADTQRSFHAPSRATRRRRTGQRHVAVHVIATSAILCHVICHVSIQRRDPVLCGEGTAADLRRTKMFWLDQSYLESVFGDPIVVSNYLEYSGHIRTRRLVLAKRTAPDATARQSIDLYSSVSSPSLTFLGTPTLSRLSSSLLSSSLTRRHTPEILPSVAKPLLPTVDNEQQPQQRRSSHSLLPPIPSRKASTKKFAKVSHEVPVPRQSSFGQAVLNGMNVLCGVGILSTPYAVKEGGWVGLSILFIFAVLSFYTGILLRECLDSQPGLETYPDIGQAAFGNMGRFAISIILYAELYLKLYDIKEKNSECGLIGGTIHALIGLTIWKACTVEHIILESDNLSALFPNAHLNLGAYELNSHHLFALLTTLAVLPTVWLRDLSVLSYISAGGVVASILVVICLFWAGLVDKVDFQSKGTTLNLTTLPVAIGLYGFCYSGHAVFPNIYTSMAKPSQYPAVLLTSFGICTLMYAGVGVMGYMMFGELTESQFTLNMPQDLLASKIAVWTTVVNPFTKYPFLIENPKLFLRRKFNLLLLQERSYGVNYHSLLYASIFTNVPLFSLSTSTYALTMTPVALCLEELIPSSHLKSYMYCILIRTALVISTLVVALSVPFFGLVMALIGSLLTMLVTLILPCACFLRILRGKVTLLQGLLCILIIVVGAVSAVVGTYSALSQIIENLS
ncbi:hypothetical protein HYC85_000595 [Camellia sinensis]|uniref:Amino acid transporter transmembrane domain-containing protein n=2 Tax=Magnoliopsida TaxID=3398 RepID=A0A7J7I4H1_CAMSI|nr:hypothetical protein HYC85_000595 [Camellia sinensis]